MFDSDPPEFAVRGERGVDVFLRVEDPGQKRARFRCIATVLDGGDAPLVIDHEPQARRPAALLLRRAQDCIESPILTQRFALGDTRSWPLAGGARDSLAVFLYHEFFRAWQVADIAGHRLHAQLTKDAESLSPDPQKLVAAVLPVFDFNRLSRGVALARLMAPVLARRIAAPVTKGQDAAVTGYALRMLGDLCLRAAEPALALACFETTVDSGDNPHRRRKAIEAAHAAGDQARLAHHRTGYQAQWPLPPDLAALTIGETL